MTVDVTVSLPKIPILVSSDPIDSDGNLSAVPGYANEFSHFSTVVLEYDEPIRAGSGAVTLEARAHRAVGKFVVVQPASPGLLPGEQYTVSVADRTVRGLTGRYGGVPTNWTDDVPNR